jgi:hypothetical protein
VEKVVFSIIFCDSIYSKTVIVESYGKRIKTFDVYARLKRISDFKENLVVGVGFAAAVDPPWHANLSPVNRQKDPQYYPACKSTSSY